MEIWKCYQSGEPVPNSDPAPHHMKIDAGETGDDGKGKVALFRKPATWEDGRLTSQRPSSPSRARPSVLKGKAQERGGGLHAGEAGSSQFLLSGHEPDAYWHPGSCFQMESGLIFWEG